ncbi:MAG: serine--tRNA ligase [Francisellaceae bacterium]|nr:serine--tRNA ligase [Francisellaceae bacterium]MBT6538508.1 serine--tRNA ligase [Francisellaceae bacterium]
MIDVKLLRKNPQEIADNLAQRGFELDVKLINQLEQQRKELQVKQEQLQASRNQKSKLIGKAKAQGEDASIILKEVTIIKSELEGIETQFNNIAADLHDYLLTVPNLVHESVPQGKNETDNVEVGKFLVPKTFDFPPKEHSELGALHDGMDFDAGAKLSGSRFVVLKNEIAHLHRALANFMLDLHTKEHGYSEINAPLLVDEKMMEGTGQFPKFKEDQYHAEDTGLWLIPTSEVTLTNLVRDTLLSEAELPKKFVSHSLCFRKEAGSYGKDTKGMIRLHQFEKVELVQVVRKEDSYQALEELCSNARAVLDKLELPYRVVSLCGGDIGFSAAKTYDLDVWLPSQECYREISSCSNTEAFQASRMQARYKDQTGRKHPVHTLNGSGLAIGRTLVAVLENYQLEDGSIEIPRVLVPYMGKDRLNLKKS